MKKLLCAILSLFLLLCMVGCSSTKDAAEMGDPYTGSTENGVPDSSLEKSADGFSDSVSGSKTEANVGTTTAMTTGATSPTMAEADRADAVATAAAAAESAKAATSAKTDSMLSSGSGGSSEIQIGAGMLTAGEWKDLSDIPFWTKLLNNNDWYQMMENRNLFPNKIVSVKVTDQNGNPCFNVPVILKDTDNKEIYKAVSDINGMAYLLCDPNNQNQQAKCISIGGTDHDIVQDGETVIVIESAGIQAQQLDLLFMIDTTGSMSDELTYLQAELRDVIRKVAASGEVFAINLSVNFYRDTGDEYVVRSFAFTEDIDKAIEQLSAQRTDGGGDYAEAVHLALENVVNDHQWRKDAIKLCFMVLDAPPHKNSKIPGIDQQLQTTVMSMAETGIRFIPVASSGVDTETEFLLRSWAVMTGGTYTFLTNHSGIGNSHLEPTIGEYKVEKLNDLLVRVISEYCGI